MYTGQRIKRTFFLDVLKMFCLLVIKYGANKKIQKKFLKNACSKGWTEFPRNLINAPNKEKKKHDAIIKNIG